MWVKSGTEWFGPNPDILGDIRCLLPCYLPLFDYRFVEKNRRGGNSRFRPKLIQHTYPVFHNTYNRTRTIAPIGIGWSIVLVWLLHLAGFGDLKYQNRTKKVGQKNRHLDSAAYSDFLYLALSKLLKVYVKIAKAALAL